MKIQYLFAALAVHSSINAAFIGPKGSGNGAGINPVVAVASVVGLVKDVAVVAGLVESSSHASGDKPRKIAPLGDVSRPGCENQYDPYAPVVLTPRNTHATQNGKTFDVVTTGGGSLEKLADSVGRNADAVGRAADKVNSAAIKVGVAAGSVGLGAAAVGGAVKEIKKLVAPQRIEVPQQQVVQQAPVPYTMSEQFRAMQNQRIYQERQRAEALAREEIARRNGMTINQWGAMSDRVDNQLSGLKRPGECVIQ